MDAFDMVIVSGGRVRKGFALRFCRKAPKARRAAADRGLLFFYEAGILPDWAVGDFDSCPEEALSWARQQKIPLTWLDVHKDDTDTRSALKKAKEEGAKRVALLGGTGTRLDHTLSNLELLVWAREEGMRLELFDEYNHIYLAEREEEIFKEKAFGENLSFLSIGGPVEGLTLEGFEYPLSDRTISVLDAGLTVSNRLAGPVGRVSHSRGNLLVIEARDEPIYE